MVAILMSIVVVLTAFGWPLHSPAIEKMCKPISANPNKFHQLKYTLQLPIFLENRFRFVYINTIYTCNIQNQCNKKNDSCYFYSSLLRSFLQCDFIFLPFNVSYCVCAHFMSIVEKNGAVQSTSIERTLSTAQARCANRSGQCIFRFPNIQFSKCDRFTAQMRFVCQFAKSPTPD